MPLAESCQALLAEYSDARRWRVALSGGVDSTVLLHLLASWPQRPPLDAIHINHQLQPDAAQWVEHCQSLTDGLGIDLTVRTVALPEGSGNLEARARRARYAVFEQLLAPGDVLMMGHQADDQAETLLLRLWRGAGSEGLAAIPRARVVGRGQLLRPLLDSTRQAIEHYARQHGLAWIDDPSNHDQHFDRNFLRQRLLPLVAERWPGYRASMQRAAAWQRESASLQADLARLDWQHLTGSSVVASSLPLSGFEQLSPARCKNLLRYWIRARGFSVPSADHQQQILDQVVAAADDAEPVLGWPGAEVRRFRQRLYLMAPLPPLPQGGVVELAADAECCIEGVGRLRFESSSVGGLRASLIDRPLQVRFRRGGERCQPVGRDHSQTLKKLFQEYQVEPWWRDRVPLLYRDDVLLAVGDIWINEGCQAAAGEAAMQLHWQRWGA